jgi:hypothetical protein
MKYFLKQSDKIIQGNKVMQKNNVDRKSVRMRSRILRWVGHRPTGDEYRIRNVKEYLDIRERKRQEAGEKCVMRSFITCIVHGGCKMKKQGTGHVGRLEKMRN